MAKNPYQGDDTDYFSAVRDKEGNVKQTGLPKSATPKKKNRIVTKEELKKSGFTNLRDFLNAERGLKRRDGKPAAKMGADKTASGMPREARGVKETPAPAVKDKEGKTASGLPREARGESRLKSDTAKAKEDMNRFMSQSGKFGTMRSGGEVKMKSGGSVSKRADGCAQRGKTRGKVI